MFACSSTVTSELPCATAGHSCCSASVMLDSRALQLRSDLETSPLSLLRRMPNQVAWKRHLCVNQRLFSVFRSSASVVSTGGSAAGSGALTASVVVGSSVLAVFLTRVHIVKVSQQLDDEV